MIAVTGYRTTIAQQLKSLLPKKEAMASYMGQPADRYLFAAGVLHNVGLLEQTGEQQIESIDVNMLRVIENCEHVLGQNPDARICVIGSMGGIRGSFDQTYAACKAGIHQYVRNCKIRPSQQIVCVAPTIIMDSGMTERRNEDGQATLQRRIAKHPKGRFLRAIEVARLVHFLLYVDEGFITNTVIETHGNE